MGTVYQKYLLQYISVLFCAILEVQRERGVLTIQEYELSRVLTNQLGYSVLYCKEECYIVAKLIWLTFKFDFRFLILE